MVKISAVVYLYVRGYLKVETSFGCAECVVLLVPHLCHWFVLTKERKYYSKETKLYKIKTTE